MYNTGTLMTVYVILFQIQNSNLSQEIFDIKDEFQKEKNDYLEFIRKLERENKLLQSIIDKVQPCIRKGCNYSNLDKIKSQSK